MNFLLVFIGGGLGSVLRYVLNIGIQAQTGDRFPYGILAINILGSFLIGLAGALVKKEELVFLLMIGVLGGFTTFSAFSLDVVNMFSQGRHLAALTYVALSVICTVSAAYIGLNLAK